MLALEFSEHHRAEMLKEFIHYPTNVALQAASSHKMCIYIPLSDPMLAMRIICVSARIPIFTFSTITLLISNSLAVVERGMPSYQLSSLLSFLVNCLIPLDHSPSPCTGIPELFGIWFQYQCAAYSLGGIVRITRAICPTQPLRRDAGGES